MKGFRWKQKSADFSLAVTMVGCGVVFFLMFFLSLTVLQAQQALHVLSFVVPRDIGEFKQYAEVMTFDELQKNSGLRDLLEEMMVRYYIEMRYTVLADQVEMARRWGSGGLVAQLSSPKLFSSFGFNIEKLKDLADKRVTQTVNVLSVVKTTTGTYTVTFDLIRHVLDARTETRMSVVLGYTYSRWYKRFQQNFVNPFGMVFIGLDQSVVK